MKAARAPEGLEEMKQEQKYNQRFEKKKPAARKQDERQMDAKPMPKWKAQSLMFR